MSTIKTLSRFFYGTAVTRLVWAVDFNEGAGELQATLAVGNYSLTEYGVELQRALRAAGSQAYVVSLNRTTRKFTISAPLNFSLLAGTGTRIGVGAWSMIGAAATDKTGANTYTMENGAGSEYNPQYYLDGYTKEGHSIELEDAAVSSTPVGYSQIASFGDGSRVPMNIRLITNKTGLKNTGFVANLNGESDFLTFIKYAMKKGRLEFMPDKTTPATFIKCFLESTSEDRDARKFKLKNMAVDIYESGTLTFRKVLI